ncbi:hypothetical protein Cgig2_026231 [Carnegiea gigantea]|uniref:Uncharacterized protein n=1 Tax=Carnegiea gigantea TaxID=171969 RepID=A0A9Q1QIV3_9CARY|nr:hypothetical protein Cgig2_026231 [Carnegiea gigantea]
MVLLKPAWLLKQDLPNQLCKVGNQLLTSLPSSTDLLALLENLEILLAHVHQNPPASIEEDALVPLKGVLPQKSLQIMQILMFKFLLLCASLAHSDYASNPPFEDELMKKVFRVIASSFQALPDSASADKSYHKRVHSLLTDSSEESQMQDQHVDSGTYE